MDFALGATTDEVVMVFPYPGSSMLAAYRARAGTSGTNSGVVLG